VTAQPQTGTFTCWECGGTFPKGWTDEEARAESAANGFDPGAADMVTVCDDCHVPPPWTDLEGCKTALSRRGWSAAEIAAGIASAETEMREWRGALATLADIARNRATEEEA